MIGGRFARLQYIPVRNWTQSVRDVVLSTVAAVLAWSAAAALFGDHPPVFAAVAAIVCLSPGVASHGRQAIGLLIGVGIGIVAGEIARTLPLDPAMRIALVTPVAMLAAASFGLNAVMVIQAGASGVFVIAGDQYGHGFQRLADAAIGGSIGLLFSQGLFTPDPIALVERAGAGLVAAASTSQGAEVRAAAAALDAAISSAQAMLRWTLRGRWQAASIMASVEHWRRTSERLVPLALLCDRNADDQGSRTALQAAIAAAKREPG